MDTGLPLLDWRPPRGPAVIIAFPTSRRRDRVDDYAARLAAGQHNAERCLSAVKRQLRRELAGAGVSPARVEREVAAFDVAVRRRAMELWAAARGQGGGIAKRT
jgi:hypothetical protein